MNIVRPIITSILLVYVRIRIINTIFSQKKIKIRITLKVFGLGIIIVGSLFAYTYLLGFMGQQNLALTNIIDTKSLLLFVAYCTLFVVLVTIFFTLRHNKNTKLPEGFYDVEGIPTTLDTSTLNEVQKLEISKAVRYRNRYKRIAQILLIGSIFFVALAYGGFLVGINTLILYYLVSAYAEEYMKYSAGNNMFLANKEPNESNLIFFCILVGLGFSAVENVLYIANSIINHENVNIINMLIGRGLVSTLIHIVSTSLIAFIMIKTKKTNSIIVPVILGIIGGFGLHSIYNLSLQYSLSYITIPIVILAFFLMTYLTFQSDIIYSSSTK
ncbi:MAG: PrsW family glutamic-type intramembrane protease [candidate division SR1 bacterium]|nr:PrsW family glutamic-type intramembrane protease [candidate division SR1 bacterium]